jgi:nucleoside-diphosphate-sugar epimerase
MFQQLKVLAILCILSCSSNYTYSKTFLVFGAKTGWIGQQIQHMLIKQGHKVLVAHSRLENRNDVIAELDQVKPDCIINAAGVTGRPNVDWCEDHKQETLRANMIGTLNLWDCAFNKNIHVINLGTGCVYEYDQQHPINSGIGFTEEEAPNFKGSFYSYTKGMIDRLVVNYPNVLNLRIRMPLADDLHPRNFITKIINYKKVVNIPNSMTILYDLLPLIPEMAERRLTGNLNFTNPGVISHNEILQLYKEYIDPQFTWVNFTLEEQAQILKAGRSNNELDTTRLLAEFPQVPHIKQSIIKLFERMAQLKNK